MTPEQAKAKVFEYWSPLEALARRRFPRSENLAHEGLLYVLDKLEAEEWKRVRSWQGLGHFLPFLTTLASRVLTDFTRERFGHIRKPAWLAERRDPLWETAYRLLIVEKYGRHEAIEQLQLMAPERESWVIEDIVSTVMSRCRERPQLVEQHSSMEVVIDTTEGGAAPEAELGINDSEILEVLQDYLQASTNPHPPADPRVAELLTRLNAQLNLADEDRLLLRLRYVEGIKMSCIVQLLHLEGDPYKREHKILRQVRAACQAAGLVPE
jgi:hypothetical protein